MTRDLSTLYVDVVNNMLDKLSEEIYDIVSSFGHCTELVMTIKLGKFNLLKETLIDMLPEEFDKSDFSQINQHFHYITIFQQKKTSPC